MSDSASDVPPVTDTTHDNSWSANLERDVHAADPDLVCQQAVKAIEHTIPGNHVNLVTHGNHGHPETYLYECLENKFGDEIDVTYVEKCGCGGHVTRVHVED